jgi:hypothetical protein
MDLERDEDQEKIIEDIICDGDDNATLLFLNNSGEGDDQNRRDGSDEGDEQDRRDGSGEGEGISSGFDEGEANGFGGTLNITMSSEVYVY